MPQATVYKMLRNRLYTGDFDWNGKTYRGVHVPIVTKELWDRVQAILDRRFGFSVFGLPVNDGTA